MMSTRLLAHGKVVGALLAALALVAAPALITGCNTIEGAGQDVSGVGRGVSNAASRTQEAMFRDSSGR